jgi:hypothetical protein
MINHTHAAEDHQDRLDTLRSRTAGGGQVSVDQAGIHRLEIPAGAADQYRLAQLDDYSNLARKNLPWHAPLSFSLSAKISQGQVPGTWGFGFWNDPFSISLGVGGGVRLFPTLPQSAWFFFASEQNALSLYDQLPAYGNLSATFRSSGWQPRILLTALLSLPSLLSPRFCRLLRKVSQNFILQSSTHTTLDVTTWHHYRIRWTENHVGFEIDKQGVYETTIVPFGPLGFVLWVDNQYLSVSPEKPVSFGSLANPKAVCLEVQNLSIQKV